MSELVHADMMSTSPAIGAEITDGFLDSVESDMAVALHRRQFQAAQRRLDGIRTDFDRVVADLKTSWSESSAKLNELYVLGLRPELVRCFLSVNRQLAVNGHKAAIERLADELIGQTVERLNAARPAPAITAVAPPVPALAPPAKEEKKRGKK